MFWNSKLTLSNIICKMKERDLTNFLQYFCAVNYVKAKSEQDKFFVL